MGGGAFLPLLTTWTGGGGYVECPCLSTLGVGGVKIGSKLVHVVVTCPLIANNFNATVFFFCPT